MAKKKAQPREDSFLPSRGQCSDDPDSDYILNALSVLLGCAWDLLCAIAVPLCSLLLFLVWGCWQPEELPKKRKS